MVELQHAGQGAEYRRRSRDAALLQAGVVVNGDRRELGHSQRRARWSSTMPWQLPATGFAAPVPTRQTGTVTIRSRLSSLLAVLALAVDAVERCEGQVRIHGRIRATSAGCRACVGSEVPEESRPTR